MVPGCNGRPPARVIVCGHASEVPPNPKQGCQVEAENGGAASVSEREECRAAGELGFGAVAPFGRRPTVGHTRCAASALRSRSGKKHFPAQTLHRKTITVEPQCFQSD